jgi:hypothetical protein
MMRSFARPRTVGTWIVVCSTLLSCSSGKQEDAVPDTSKAGTVSDTGKDTVYVIDSADVYREDWSTPLPQGVSPNAEQFRARIAPGKFSGTRWVRKRAGKCLGNCPVDVAIEAIAPTRTIDLVHPARPARAVARIENLDATRTEAYYGLKPSTRADYYLWVDWVSGRTRMTMLEVPRGSGRVRGGRYRNLQVCHSYRHGPDSTDFGDADFIEYHGPCDSAGIKRAALIPSVSLVGIANFFRWAKRAPAQTELRSEGGWIDCNSGCCW